LSSRQNVPRDLAPSGRAANDLPLVRAVLEQLHTDGADCWLFGGWAEEVLGLIPPRPHTDIDLLYPAQDFEQLERIIRRRRLDEVEGKRFLHKRAVVLFGVMVEFFLVRQGKAGYFTSFWGSHRHGWPADVFSSVGDLRVASANGVRGYRLGHAARRAAAIRHRDGGDQPMPP